MRGGDGLWEGGLGPCEANGEGAMLFPPIGRPRRASEGRQPFQRTGGRYSFSHPDHSTGRFPMRHAAFVLLLTSTALAMTSGAHAAATALASEQEASIAYPSTERQDIVETQFGVAVPDPYRWLENDVREDAKVAAWVGQQNKATDAYLATLPGRATFEQRLRALYDYERFGIPRKQGSRYFYTRNTGLQNQNVLYVQESLAAEPELQLDRLTGPRLGNRGVRRERNRCLDDRPEVPHAKRDAFGIACRECPRGDRFLRGVAPGTQLFQPARDALVASLVKSARH